MAGPLSGPQRGPLLDDPGAASVDKQLRDAVTGNTGGGNTGAPLPATTGRPFWPGFSEAQIKAAQAWYQGGYDRARAGQLSEADRIIADDGVLPQAGQPRMFYTQGYDAGRAGRAPSPPQRTAQGGGRVVTPPLPAGQGKPGIPVPMQPGQGAEVPLGTSQPPLVSRLDPRIGYELYGSILLFGGRPLDVVEGIEALIPFAVRYQLLGRRARDFRRGFRLSGPDGPVIREARRRYPGQGPQVLGGPVWVGARTRRGVELLSFGEVSDLLGPGWAG